MYLTHLQNALALIEGKAEQRLLDLLLKHCQTRGWVKERGKQRTDSTHVLAATRTLNRLESIGETLQAALNQLASVDPGWLRTWVPQEWFARYSRAIDEYRLPKGVEPRREYAETIGREIASDTTGHLDLKRVAHTPSACCGDKRPAAR